jgi:subtilisin family serine protease
MHFLAEPLENRRLLALVPVGPLAPLNGLPVDRIEWLGQTTRVLPGRWIVQLDNAQTRGPLVNQVEQVRDSIAALGAGFAVDRHLGANGLFLVNTPPALDPATTLASLAVLPGYRFAEPDMIYDLALSPNDPRYTSGELWGMHNTGQNGGVADIDIDAPEAWDLTTGSSSVVIGNIDSGIHWAHPDLAANIWSNPGEIAGNGIDDDGNGYIDDIRGWDFWSNDNDPTDPNGHGTHTAGTIGAVGNNSVGVVGVAWNVRLIGLKVGDAGPSISVAGATAALNYVADLKQRGINVRATNNSWGGGGYSQSLLNAINLNNTRGIMFLAAAGNAGANNDVSPNYPSNYDVQNVIAVANITRTGARNSTSSYGATTVDLGAPGTDTLSTLPGTSYGSASGTSMATPHVTGTVALMVAARPNATIAEIRSALLSTTDPTASMAGITVTGGRLNAFKAVQAIMTDVIPPDPPSAPQLDPGSDSGISNSDGITNVTTPTYTGTAEPLSTVRLFADGVQVGQATTSAGGTWTIVSSVLANGIRNMTATATDAANNVSGTSPASSVVIDTVAPTPNFAVVSPDPRSTPLDTINIGFGESVFGVDKSDMRLTRNGSPNLLTPTGGFTVLGSGNFRLSNLATLTNVSGRFELRFVNAGSGVTDAAGNPPTGDAVRTFKVQLPMFRGDAPGTTSDSWHVRLQPGGANVEVFENESTLVTPTYLISTTALGLMTFEGLAGNDTLTINYSNGNPLPGGVRFINSGHSTIRIMGGGTFPMTTNPATDTPALTVELLGGSIQFAAPLVELAALNVGSDTATVTAAGNRVLKTKSLLIGAGSLDLTDNDLIVDYTGASPLAAIRSWLTAGRNNGTWNGSGIRSSSAASQPNQITGLGALESAAYIAANGTSVFSGQSLDSTAVVVKYTYNGDTDLNGVVDFDDYARIDTAFLGAGSGTWLEGDSDYSSVIDFDDYALIDSAFLLQGPVL